MELEAAVDTYVGEWMKDLPPPDADQNWYKELFQRTVPLNFSNEPFNWINQAGNTALWKASKLLIQRQGEQRRITKETARRCFIEAHFAHLPKARKTRRISEHAIIAGATKRLANCKRLDGLYVIPLCFAPSAMNTRFRIGPAIVLSKVKFEEKYLPAILRNLTNVDSFDHYAATQWQSYNDRYDHYLVVEIKRHEHTMAWKTAREVAEYVLNLIRIKFGFHHMDDVRTGNGFVWETTQVKAIIDRNGSAQLEMALGPWGSTFDDNWVNHFDSELAPHADLLASLALWMASGDAPLSPVLERLRYANALIAEAYSEPHSRIRLVRLVAALEALASLPKGEKSDAVVWRCAFAGGWTDCGIAVQIVDDMRRAYTARNAVVHGDPIDDDEILDAFYLLERNLPGIYLGFLTLYAKIQQCYRPTHKRHIHAAFDEHIEAFFWMPDEVW